MNIDMNRDEPIRLIPLVPTPERPYPEFPEYDDYKAWPPVKRREIVKMGSTLTGSRYFTRAWAVVGEDIETYAWSITQDKDEWDDLTQIAMITLWLGDASRYNWESERHVGYVKTVLRHRMQNAWKTAANRFRSYLDSLVAGLPHVGEDDPRIQHDDENDEPLANYDTPLPSYDAEWPSHDTPMPIYDTPVPIYDTPLPRSDTPLPR